MRAEEVPATTTSNVIIVTSASSSTPAVAVDSSGNPVGHIRPLSSVPAAGKVYVRAFAVILLALSIAELVASALVIHNSSGYYVGGIYVSILTLVTALTVLPPDNIRSASGMGWIVVYTSLDLLVCVIGLAISAANLNFVDSIEACANYSSTINDSCGVSGLVNCYGDEDYFPQARVCEVDYITDNAGDVSSDYCTCVTDSDDDTCYNYDNMESCNNFLRRVPGQLAVSVAFLVLLNVTLVGLFAASYLSRYRPELVKTREEAENESLDTTLMSSQYLSSAAPANTATPATVV